MIRLTGRHLGRESIKDASERNGCASGLLPVQLHVNISIQAAIPQSRFQFNVSIRLSTGCKKSERLSCERKRLSMNSRRCLMMAEMIGRVAGIGIDKATGALTQVVISSENGEVTIYRPRSEERRVGKECRSR